MVKPKSTISFVGIGLGACALLLALLHFWAGPFSPQPTLEQSVAEKAVAIKNATLSALKGEQVPPPQQQAEFTTDRILSITTAFLGGIAIIFGVIAYAKKEPARAASGAVMLGFGAIAFQFLVLAIGAIVIAILVAGVLGNFDLS